MCWHAFMLFMCLRNKSWWEALNSILAYSMQCLLCMKACRTAMCVSERLYVSEYVTCWSFLGSSMQVTLPFHPLRLSITDQHQIKFSDMMICLSRSMYVCVPFNGVLQHWLEATAVNVQHTHTLWKTSSGQTCGWSQSHIKHSNKEQDIDQEWVNKWLWESERKESPASKVDLLIKECVDVNKCVTMYVMDI